MVATSAMFHMIDGPVSMQLTFRLTAPKSVRREHPTVRPDLDKLVRAVLDALTGLAYKDDSQVVSIQASKTYWVDPGLRGVVQPLDTH